MAVDPLLAWYDAARRDLPWRRTRDPWAIWVSEVMLQQTRVDTAVPFFERFLARFPSPESLAAAPLDAALALWSGLGYYRRCRQLHAAAVQVAGTGIPRRAAELERLPGVGAYTAAAIASIAFGERVAVLDGNVVRVVSRLLAEPGDVARAAVRRRLLEAATARLDPARPGDGNQALMELGATLCSPRAPACGRCPLLAQCRAAATGRAEEFPAPRRRRPPVGLAELVAVVERDREYLLVRRGAQEAVMPGLWEFPTVAAEGDPAAALAARFGGSWWLEPPLAHLRHGITFRSLRVAVVAARWMGGDVVAEVGEAGWFSAERAAALALTGVTRKALARLPAPGAAPAD
jgi:A/G-specific adenine glycosylase